MGKFRVYMPSLERIETDYPNLRVIGDLAESGYITQESQDAFYANLQALSARYAAGETDLNFRHPDQIDPPHEIIISCLLSQNKFTALAVAVEALPPMEGHYYFCVESITVVSSNDAGIIAYIRKEELDGMRAQTSLNAILQGNNYFANLSKLLRMPDFGEFSRFFANPEAIHKSFLAIKKTCYYLHTEGFLTALSKPKSQAKLVTFMYEKFNDYLTLEDLCNLRLVCKKDKNASVAPFTPQRLILS
jgi:hypothetical protein